MRDPRPAPTTRGRRALILGLVALVAAACGESPQTVLDPISSYSEDPDTLFRVTVVIALAVFIVVQGLLIYSVLKFRDKGDETPEPEQVHGNTRLELVWTIIPAVILAGIAVPTVQQVFQLAEEQPDALVVEVIGHRWWWEYVYPDQGIITANELVVPEDTPIRLVMTAEEAGSAENAVLHSYWVPALGGKQDVVPGRITTLNLQADEPGNYIGQCTEYCGLSHANMRNFATVLPQAEFDQWVAEQQAPAPEPEPGSLAAEGQALYNEVRFVENYGLEVACASCHMINGEGAMVGPNLTHFMSREKYAGSIFDLYEREDETWNSWTDEVAYDQLYAWIDNAPEQKAMQPNDDPRIGMPWLEFEPDEVEAIVAYLMTLE